MISQNFADFEKLNFYFNFVKKCFGFSFDFLFEPGVI